MAGDKIKANDVGLPAIDGKFFINVHFEMEWWHIEEVTKISA
jgi:hypothetical protein